MTDADHFRLLGTYTTPLLPLGTVLTCKSRDCDLIIVDYTNPRIPWPLGRK